MQSAETGGKNPGGLPRWSADCSGLPAASGRQSGGSGTSSLLTREETSKSAQPVAAHQTPLGQLHAKPAAFSDRLQSAFTRTVFLKCLSAAGLLCFHFNKDLTILTLFRLGPCNRNILMLVTSYCPNLRGTLFLYPEKEKFKRSTSDPAFLTACFRYRWSPCDLSLVVADDLNLRAGLTIPSIVPASR